MSNPNGVGAAVVLEQTALDPNRKTTPQDVQSLVRVYARLTSVVNDHKVAQRNLQNALTVWSKDNEATLAALQAEVEVATKALTSTMIECRAIIQSLPNGTTGPGGKATRQTIVLEFYGSVNRDLKGRLTPADAKRINKAAFAGI